MIDFETVGISHLSLLCLSFSAKPPLHFLDG